MELLSFVLVLVIFILFLAFLTAPRTSQVASDPQKLAQTDTVAAVDLGDGLYFLDVGDGPSWLASLKRFVKENPSIRITAIAPAAEGRGGAFNRILVTEHRHNCPCHDE